MIRWQPIVPGAVPADGSLPPLRSKARPSQPSTLRAVAELPLLAAAAILIAFVLKTFVAQAFYIPSESMVPQLEIGDRVVVSKLAYRLHDPRRGDIVVFDSPEETAADDEPALPVRVFHDVLEAIGVRQPPEEELIKRVIGLPGDAVEAHDGKVFVNGVELVEPYLSEGVLTSDFSRRVVPEGHLWMMGDNRTNSLDSRVFGAVDVDRVVGRALFRVWPPGRTAFL